MKLNCWERPVMTISSAGKARIHIGNEKGPWEPWAPRLRNVDRDGIEIEVLPYKVIKWGPGSGAWPAMLGMEKLRGGKE
jgi:hypothetical protein